MAALSVGSGVSPKSIFMKRFLRLFLAFWLLLSQGGYAWECIPPTYSISEKIEAANEIFVARIMKSWVEEDTYTVASVTAEGSSLTDHKYFRYFAEYELIQKVRGRPEVTGVLEASQEPFRVELIPSYVYLVLLQDSNETGVCEGTVRLDRSDIHELEVNEQNLEKILSNHASWPREVVKDPQ